MVDFGGFCLGLDDSISFGGGIRAALYTHFPQECSQRGGRRNGTIHQLRDASFKPHAVCEAGIGGISARTHLGLGVTWHFSPLEVRFWISVL